MAGITSGNGTSKDFLVRFGGLFLLIIFAGVATYGTDILFKGIPEESVGFMNYAKSVVTERGWIPYVEIFFFAFAIGWLLLRFATRQNQKFLFAQVKGEWGKVVGNNSTIPASNISGVLTKVEGMPQRLRSSIAGNRLCHAIRRFNKTKSSHQVATLLETLSEMDRDNNDSAYGSMRFIVWLIPTLGFIGTVIGIGMGIAGFGNIIEVAGSFDGVREQIPTVTHNLGVAFDTTLLALLLTATMLAIMSYMQQRDDAFLGNIDRFCVEDIAGSFEETDQATQQLAGQIQRIYKLIEERVQPANIDLKKIESNLDTLVQQTEGIEEVKESMETLVDQTQSVNSIKIAAEELKDLCKSIFEDSEPQPNLFRYLNKSRETISENLGKIEQAIKDSSEAEGLERVLGEIKEVADAASNNFGAAVTEMKQTAEEVGKNLAEVVKGISDYVNNSGMGDAAQFTQTVGELKQAIEPIGKAMTAFEEASQQLAGLSELSGIAEKMKNAADHFKEGGKNAAKGGDEMVKATAGLEVVLQGNADVLAEVKEVLGTTTASVTELKTQITNIGSALLDIQEVMTGIHKAIFKMQNR